MNFPSWFFSIFCLVILASPLRAGGEEQARSKLSTIVISHVEFAGEPLSMAVDKVRKLSADSDPLKVGVDVVVKASRDGVFRKPISLNMSDVTLLEVFEEIGRQSGMKVGTEGSFVTLTPVAL